MSRKAGGTLTQQQLYWLEQVRSCKSSGKSMKVYATEQGIDVNVLYAWKKILVKKGVLPRTRPLQFQQAQVVAPVSRSEWHVQLPNGVSVSFSGTMDPVTLTSVLNAASAVS